MKNNIRISVSGTFCTGKTSITKALSLLTGIPSVHITCMNQLLSNCYPGKAPGSCSPFELFHVSLLRFIETIVKESSMKDGFISDESPFHQYVYSTVSLENGWIYLNNNLESLKGRIGLISHKSAIQSMLESYKKALQEYAIATYDSFIHLPVEFPLKGDNIPPYMNIMRKSCDELLLKTIEDLGIQYYVVTGSITERISKILNIYNLTPVMDMQKALEGLEL